MDKEDKILVTGAQGMVGKNLMEELQKKGFSNIIPLDLDTIDFTEREKVFKLFEKEKPAYVFHIAALVKGIKEMTDHPTKFLKENILINTNVIDACFESKVKKLINLSSAAIYPKSEGAPPREETLLKGTLEEEVEAYALSKIIGLKLCEYYNKEHDTNFITLISPNIYGEHSRFDPGRAHVAAALIAKFNNAISENKNEVEIWGSGEAKREFIYAKDLCKIMITAMRNIDKTHTHKGFLNCGLGDEISIKELATLIKEITNFKGELKFDTSKPEGTMRRAIDSSKFLNLIKFENKTNFKEGLIKINKFFLFNNYRKK